MQGQGETVPRKWYRPRGGSPSLMSPEELDNGGGTMYYVKVDPDTFLEFHEAMGTMWEGMYCLTNPQTYALDELLAVDEIWARGTVTYKEIA